MGKQVALGNKVRDVISGFEGIATSRHISTNRQPMIGIQPLIDKKKPGDHPDAISFDEIQVQYVGPGQAKLTTRSPKIDSFALGDEVRDRTTGLVGIATSLTEFMNGCSRVSIQAKLDKDGAPPKHYHADYQDVERVGDGLNVKKESAATAPKPKTGGAPMKVERR
jgi:hypothetical protein